MNITSLVSTSPFLSDQVSQREVIIILEHLEKVIANHVPGDVVEFGCYVGTTSVFLQKLLHLTAPDRQLHVYDSFDGLPEKSTEDNSPIGTQFITGELRTSKKTFINNFHKYKITLPFIHVGWFHNLTPDDIPSCIAFAYFDGDYFKSIEDSFKLVIPRLSIGAIIIVDDYQSEALPGAAKAVNHYLQINPKWRLRVEASLAIIQT